MLQGKEDVKAIKAIEGYKGKKPRAPKEAKDTLFSEEYARILDLISEGEIGGLVNGMKSIYLDGTPLENPDGTFNFENVVIEERVGTQAQSPIPYFPASENEITLGVEVKYEQPVVRQFTNQDLTAVVVRLSTPMLQQTDAKTGDRNGYRIPFAIMLQTDNGIWKEVHNSAFNGKTTAKYVRSIRVELPKGANSWSIRVVRFSKHPTTANIQDKLYVDAFVEVIDANLSYPNSALIGIGVLAEQFQSIPQRGYEVYGIKVKIPSNYNPRTRAYTGTWDGSFKVDWTDNPAWIFHALATHPLYGLGDKIQEAQMDKWGLYQIARHCDQLVPDGRGGSEPRFTINTYIQNRGQAYELLQNIASIFRGMAYYAVGSIFAVSDRPSIESPFIFSPSNVIEGKFNYQGSPHGNRYSVAIVGWNDPDDMYRRKHEYVEDRKALMRYGYQPTEFNAFGCTSQGQAQRAGRWALLTSNFETQVVSFTVGLEALKVIPGSICAIQDPIKANLERVSGRISERTARTITVDRDLDTTVRVGNKLLVTMPNGTTQERTIANVNGRTITVGTNFTGLPQVEGQWAIETAVKLQLYRVLSIADKGEMQFEIRATQHEPQKYDAIETNTKIEPRPTTNWGSHGLAPRTPTELDLRAQVLGIEGSASSLVGEITWSSDVATHILRYRRNEEGWVTQGVTGTSYEIPNFKFGTYALEVTAVNIRGVRSGIATATKVVTGVTFELDTPKNLRMVGKFTSSWLKVVWDKVAGATGYTVRVTTNNIVRREVQVGDALRFEYSAADMKEDGGPWRTITITVMATGPFSKKSDWASLTASNPQIKPLQGIQIDNAIHSAFLTYKEPEEDDFAGVIVNLDTKADFTPSAQNQVFEGDLSFITLNKTNDGKALEPKKDYYVRIAGYDTFGKDNLNYSPSLKVSPQSNVPDVGVIVDEMIADAAITQDKLMDGLEAVLIVDKMPTTLQKNKTISFQGKLYTWDGTKYASPVTDISANELSKGLSDRIDLIDGTQPGSVSARIETKAKELSDEISATASLVTKVQSTAAGSGDNLVRNSSFEQDSNGDGLADDFEAYLNPFNGVVPTSVRTLVDGRLGGKAQQIQVTTATTNTQGVQFSLIHGFKVGVDYIISFYAKKVAGAGFTNTLLGWNTTPQIQNVLENPNLSTTEWNRYVYHVKWTSGNPQNRVYVSRRGTSAVNDAFIIDDVMVHEGELPKGYTASTTHTSAVVEQNTESIDGINAKHTVKIDNNGYVSGYGLISSANNATPTSTFSVLANRFIVAHPTTPNVVPFILSTDKGAARLAMNGDLIVEGTITAPKISAGAVGATHIQTDSLTARHFALADFTNLLVNDFGSGNMDGWENVYPQYGTIRHVPSQETSAQGAWQVNSQGRAQFVSREIPVEPDEEYLFTCYAYTYDNVNDIIVWGRVTDSNGEAGSWPVITSSKVKGSWHKLTGTIKIPAGKTKLKIYLATTIDSGQFNGVTHWSRPKLLRRNTAQLIVDGAVTARHILAGSIETQHMKANSVNAETVLASRSITAPLIKFGEIDGNHVKTKSLKATHIDVANLSAINANMGHITTGTFELAGTSTGGFWGYMKTKGKQPNDGKDGFTIQYGSDGSSYTEFKAQNSIIKLWGGPTYGTGGGAFIDFGNGKFRVDHNGNMTIKALNVIDRAQIRGGAVTSTQFHTPSGGATSTPRPGTTLGERVLWSTTFPANTDMILIGHLFGSTYSTWQTYYEGSTETGYGAGWRTHSSGALLTLRLTRGSSVVEYGTSFQRIIKAGVGGKLEIVAKYPTRDGLGNWRAEMGLISTFR